MGAEIKWNFSTLNATTKDICINNFAYISCNSNKVHICSKIAFTNNRKSK